MLGDVYQPPPTLNPLFEAPFHHQTAVSLYTRLLSAGAITVWFTLQYRFIADIADLVNAVLPHEYIRTSEKVTERDISKRAAEYFKSTFSINHSVTLIGLDGTAEENMFTYSTYNLEHARCTFYFTLNLIEYGFEPSEIRLAIPYTAQLSVYTVALHGL
jgi:hypothetical protein